MPIHYNKLVRDRIPEIIRESGRNCEIEIMDDAEYRQALLIDHKSVANDRQVKRFRWIVRIGAYADQRVSGTGRVDKLRKIGRQCYDALVALESFGWNGLRCLRTAPEN